MLYRNLISFDVTNRDVNYFTSTIYCDYHLFKKSGFCRTGWSLEVKRTVGNKREVDMSCDYKFMEKAIPKVGKKIRETYHCVSRTIPIFLYLDNAGGHGMNEVVDMYIKALKDDLNIICVHQRPCSPVTNMLDLGVWMALQNVFERLHLRMHIEPNTLCNIVEEVWKKLDSIKLQNVYNHWKNGA